MSLIESKQLWFPFSAPFGPLNALRHLLLIQLKGSLAWQIVIAVILLGDLMGNLIYSSLH